MQRKELEKIFNHKITVETAEIADETSRERLSQEEKDEQAEFYRKIVGVKKQGRAEIGFSVKTWHDKNNNTYFFVFSNFYVYTSERFIRYLKTDELFNEICSKIKLSENSKKFINFINEIGKVKRSEEYINKEEGEIIIPEILVPKAVVFLRNMAENYNKNILFPAQTCISAEKEFYTLKFEKFCGIIPVGKEYAAVKDSQGNEIAVYNVGNENLEKIKYLAEFERQNKVLKLAVKAAVLKEILESLEMVSAITGFLPKIFMTDERKESDMIQINALHLVLTFSFMIRYWEKEFKKYLPLWKVKTVEGSIEERMKIIKRAKTGYVLIASYNNFETDFLQLKFMSFGNIIYDEALYIENREKFEKKSVYLKSDNKYFLKEGFLWNNFRDIYHLFTTEKSDYPANKKIFESRDIKIGEVVKNIIMDMDSDKKYREFYIKYLKKINRMIFESGDKHTVSQRKLFTIIKRLGQICSHPKILQSDFCYETEKIKALDLFLQKCIDKNLKTVVLSQYDGMLEIFREKFKRKWKKGFVNLKMSFFKRNKIYNRFKIEKNFILFAMRIDFKELAEINCDVIIYYDPPWKDRIKGRAEDDYLLKNIIEINLIVKGTIEEKVLKQKALARNNIVTDIIKSLEKYSDITVKGIKRYDMKEVIELFQL